MSCCNDNCKNPCCKQPRCCKCSCHAGGLNAYGGIFYDNPPDNPLIITIDPVNPLVQVPFNTAMVAAKNVTAMPINSLTVGVDGVYEIYYYFSADMITGTTAQYALTLNGMFLSSATQGLTSGKNVVTGTLFIALSAGDVISAVLMSSGTAQLELSPGVSAILTVKKISG